VNIYDHIPVLLNETIESLNIRPSGRYFDGTIGLGGHAYEILKRSAPDGFLFGCDCDEAAIELALQRLKDFSGRFEIRQGFFDKVALELEALSFDGALLDLGVSSMQLDDAARGFSFLHDGPLDMRMNKDLPVKAADILSSASEEELAYIFKEYGEEKNAKKFARAIVRARVHKRFSRTLELARFIECMEPRPAAKIHPATKVFMALRIAVNQELDRLKDGLTNVWRLIKVGGRLCVITFHSIEDRIVKEFGRRLSKPYEYDGDVDEPDLRRPCEPRLRWVYKKAIRPTDEDVRNNPRCRSAQLRVFEKIHA